MSSGPFDDPHLDAAWRAYAEEDRRLAPKPELEQRTIARWQSIGLRSRRPLWQDLSVAAAVMVAVWLSWPGTQPAGRQKIAVRTFDLVELAATVAADRPRTAVPPQRQSNTTVVAAPVESNELPEVLMTFDAAPMQAHEPLQMVRLRLPREALQALGLALLEPDANGVVDVDVLVGEDGLPRDIRRVRIGQEQR